jgi:hypothetical protein
MAEAGGVAVDAVLMAAGADRLASQPDGVGIEHRLGQFDTDQVPDGECHQGSE